MAGVLQKGAAETPGNVGEKRHDLHQSGRRGIQEGSAGRRGGACGFGPLSFGDARGGIREKDRRILE
jgi:hypothetical protein